MRALAVVVTDIAALAFGVGVSFGDGIDQIKVWTSCDGQSYYAAVTDRAGHVVRSIGCSEMVMAWPRRRRWTAGVRWMDGRSDLWAKGAGWAGLVDVGVPRRLDQCVGIDSHLMARLELESLSSKADTLIRVLLLDI